MIKKIVFILILISAKVFAQTQLDAVIMGSIKNAKSNYIELKYLNNPIDDTLQSLRIELNEQGQFYQALPIRKPLEASLVYNQHQISLYIEPEENIEIRTEDKNIFQSLLITGTYKNNQFLLDFKKAFPEQKLLEERNTHIINDDADDYKIYEDNLYREKIKYIDQYAIDQALSKQFIRRQKATYRYGSSNAKFRLANTYLYLTQNEKKLPKDYYQFMLDLSVRENDLLLLAEYREYLDNYYTFRYNEDKPEVNTELEMARSEYSLAENLFEDRVKYYFLTKKFGEILETHPYEISKNYISPFMSEVANSEYRAYIDKKILAATNGSNESKAFDFRLKDQNGKWVRLSDFKGKTVYLNFWASWCLPCMGEITNHNLINRIYKDREFVTVMISIDEDINAWKNTLSQYDKEIVQLNMSGMKNEVGSKYNLKQIPKSLVINKDGVIIHSNVPAPSSASVYKYLVADKK